MKFKPCPFCGRIPLFTESDGIGIFVHHCKLPMVIEFHMKTLKQIQELWNKRI